MTCSWHDRRLDRRVLDRSRPTDATERAVLARAMTAVQDRAAEALLDVVLEPGDLRRS